MSQRSPKWSTHAWFKYCLGICKLIEDRAKADSLARMFLLKDDISVWKDIKHIVATGGNVSPATVGNRQRGNYFFVVSSL